MPLYGGWRRLWADPKHACKPNRSESRVKGQRQIIWRKLTRSAHATSPGCVGNRAVACATCRSWTSRKKLHQTSVRERRCGRSKRRVGAAVTTRDKIRAARRDDCIRGPSPAERSAAPRGPIGQCGLRASIERDEHTCRLHDCRTSSCNGGGTTRCTEPLGRAKLLSNDGNCAASRARLQ